VLTDADDLLTVADGSVCAQVRTTPSIRLAAHAICTTRLFLRGQVLE
jgi:hypothetical protein